MSTCRQVKPLIPGQPVFALSPEYCVFSGDAPTTTLIVFSLTRSGLKLTIYRIRDEHSYHSTSYVVMIACLILWLGQ